ncbi:ABC transporter ATP-binding protein [Pseudonocardia sichuanensis]|uniref:Putative ABC transport system ATP-binding protein n=1 Tax=Pseudonocardia kunmingensis TaxID=630975 RepID=A0A543E289_9PSEU|nr:ABC transporter ATP-binding protein [Pseudonocardia kunmingensis]TQM15706.1 putative ABC transport system ATP-binding protein [Pseudonocardia kunmingensis]
MTPPVAPPVLRGVGLTRRFGATTVLRGADLAVHRGEVLAVTGPSGSGKSTLLHCLAGILAPDEGEVWLGGDRIDAWPEARRTALRGARLGFVFQFGQLLPELPAVENVALPLMLRGVRRAAAVARAGAWFPALGLAGLEQRRPGQLSGGQEQRVAIARALVTEPEVVFADEPTGALDSETGRRLMELLVALAARTGAALVVVTHDADVAARCHRTVVLRDGHTGAARVPTTAGTR